MNHNWFKKHVANKRRLEAKLNNDLSPIFAIGSFLNTCMKKDAKNKNYKNAKKRYLQILDEAEANIKNIRKAIEEMENDAIRFQTKEKLYEADMKALELIDKGNQEEKDT